MRGALLVTISFVAAACSLANLDGFTGGDAAAPAASHDDGRDGGSEAAASKADADADAGPPSTDPYGDAVRADAPTSWWRFEDPASSQTLHDEMGQHDAQVLPRGNHPISIQWGIPGVVGKAAQIGNYGGFFKVGDVFDFAGDAELAVEAWIQNDSPNAEYESFFNKRIDNDTGADTGWILYIHAPDRDLGFQFWKNTVVNAGAHTMFPATGFHHVVLTATKKPDGREYVLYLDGMPMDHDSKVTTLELDTAANLIFGYGWSGALDEMGIYEHPLTPERVTAHFKAARP